MEAAGPAGQPVEVIGPVAGPRCPEPVDQPTLGPQQCQPSGSAHLQPKRFDKLLKSKQQRHF